MAFDDSKKKSQKITKKIKHEMPFVSGQHYQIPLYEMMIEINHKSTTQKLFLFSSYKKSHLQRYKRQKKNCYDNVQILIAAMIHI